MMPIARLLGCPFRIGEAGEVLDRFPCSCLSESNRLGDFSGDLNLDACHILRVNYIVCLEPSMKSHDRALSPPSLDLGFITVELHIKHRMGAEPIGTTFEKIGLSGFTHRLDSPPRSGLDRDHVHTVDGLRCKPIACRLEVN